MADSESVLKGPNMFINFGVMNDICNKAFRKDRMDIGRKGTITDEDGWEVEISPTEPIYKDVPCLIEGKSEASDMPDTTNQPTNPIITTFRIYCDKNADIKNGDYITMKTCDVDGTILEIQTGIAAEPMQFLSGTEFLVGVAKFN